MLISLAQITGKVKKMVKEGIIVKCISNLYTVKCNNLLIEVKPRGNFRNKNITPLVGDKVIVDVEKKVIDNILDRKNKLIRPPLANIDQVIIVTSVKHPDYSSLLLDKMIMILEYNNIRPILCFTKLDLCNENEKDKFKEIMTYYKNIGYITITNDELDVFKTLFKNKLTVFTGQSGAGKSTLLNKIDSGLHLKTGEISKALNRGKHTTRHVELFEIYDGLVSDTPGFSALDITNIDINKIKDLFVDIKKYSNTCKYSDCMHVKEEECNIKKKVEDGTILKSRYNSYVNFINNKMNRTFK